MFSTVIEILFKDLKIDFSRLVVFCFLVSKICLYISIAPLWTYLLEFLEENFTVSELKIIKLLISLSFVSLALVLGEAVLNRVLRMGMEDWHGFPEHLYKKLEQGKLESLEILKMFSNSILDALVGWGAKKILVYLPSLIIIMVLIHLFLLPFTVLVLFSLFDIIITRAVAVISFLFAIGIFLPSFLTNVTITVSGSRPKEDSISERRKSVFEDILEALLSYLVVLNKFNLKIPFYQGLPGRILAGLSMLFLANPWFFILKHDYFIFRLFVYTVKPEELKMENFGNLLGYYHDVDLSKSSSPKHVTSRYNYFSVLGDAIYYPLKNESRKIFSIEIQESGLILLREKYKNNLLIKSQRKILDNYIRWVFQTLQSLKTQFRSLPGFEIKSLHELNLDRERMSILFRKSPVVLSLDFEPQIDRDAMSVLTLSLKKEKLILATTALLMQREEDYCINIAKDSRKKVSEMEIFFVLPIVFIFCFE